MSVVATYIQQPSERLDYTFDYTDMLKDGDTISSATAVASPSGLTVSGVTTTPTTIRFWVNGGSVGAKYKVTVTATTTNGRVKQDEAVFSIKEF